MSDACIYAIENTLNGKRYVGSALNKNKRWTLHLSNLRNGSHHCLPLQRAWEKYGQERFAFIVLEAVSEVAELLAREQFWIDKALAERRCYNMARVAGSRLGMKASEETRQRMSLAARGRVFSPEAREKMRAAALARSPEVAARIAASRPRLTHTEETKAVIAAKITGIKRSPETRAKVGAASKGRKHSPEAIARRLESRRLKADARARGVEGRD